MAKTETLTFWITAARWGNNWLIAVPKNKKDAMDHCENLISMAPNAVIEPRRVTLKVKVKAKRG